MVRFCGVKGYGVERAQRERWNFGKSTEWNKS